MAGMEIKARAKAAARALLVASPTSQSEDTRQRVIEWLKITVLPVVLFVIGACIWGCIKNSTAWRMLTKEDEGSARSEQVEVLRCDSTQGGNDNFLHSDIHVELDNLEVGQVRVDVADAHVDGPVGETISQLETSLVVENDVSRVNKDSSK